MHPIRAKLQHSHAGAGRRRYLPQPGLTLRYTIKNVSRAWSYETSVLLEQPLDNDIPYNSFIEWYAPTYRLHLDPSPSLENKNTTESLDELMCVL